MMTALFRQYGKSLIYKADADCSIDAGTGDGVDDELLKSRMTL